MPLPPQATNPTDAPSYYLIGTLPHDADPDSRSGQSVHKASSSIHLHFRFVGAHSFRTAAWVWIKWLLQTPSFTYRQLLFPVQQD
jgi:hypothetical protein